MLKLINDLLKLNFALGSKLRAIQAFDEGIALYEANEFKKALPLIEESAELAHPPSMALLGTIYLLGQGTKENGRLAEDWLQRAIEAGHEDAISVLGMAYATGKAGVRIDFEKAMPMLVHASERGDEKAERMLTMIRNGEGMFRRLKRQR